ncbi:MAG: NADH-quinone oxidoreductase subunit G, partial [Rubrivivax sp.]|nr:NADH-quinone oxidoreductase subunit G [Rubrivivax sp.]
NAEGRLQAFHGVAKPLGDTRPGWKVLRVLGNLLGLPGFDFETVEDVRAEALGDAGSLAARLDNDSSAAPAFAPAPQGLQRMAAVPVYATDMLVRRAPALQATADARTPTAALPPALFAQVGARVKVTQGTACAVLDARADASLAEGTVRIDAGHAATLALGAMFGTVTVEKA